MLTAVKVGVAATVAALLLILAAQTGIIRFGSPFDNLRLPRDVVTVTQTFEQPEEAEVVRIEPISLDCRARIEAVVAVEGRREHRLMGQVYRTDRVEITAIGDVDTCMDADAIEIEESPDGAYVVTVPAEAIRFVRPRVDAVATAGSVRYDQGFVGEVTDLVPGVDDTEPLTGGAYAYAQQVIGGSECMANAFHVTRQIIEQAYVDQMMAQGVPIDSVEVIVEEPDFSQHELPDLEDGVAFQVDGPVRCVLADDAHGGVSPSWQELEPEV